MDQHQGNNIKVLSEQLELLRITKEDISDRTTEINVKIARSGLSFSIPFSFLLIPFTAFLFLELGLGLA